MNSASSQPMVEQTAFSASDRWPGDAFCSVVSLAPGVRMTGLAAGAARSGREGQGADNTAKAADAATYVAVGVAQETVKGGIANGDVK